MINNGEIAREITRCLPKNKQIVVIAIGSDRVTGDCLGPLVGHMLANTGIMVYGDLVSPVTALSVEETYDVIKKRHPKAVVIAVDSAVGADKDIGKIKVLPKGLRPAAAVGRRMPVIGNISVIGVVSSITNGTKGLGEVRLGYVYRMARAISQAIASALSSRDYKVFNISTSESVSSSVPMVMRR